MPTSSLTPAVITWTEEGFPYSTAFDDVYFSGEGLAETRYVFLEGNRLPERFAQLPADTSFTIAETGFGTGLNILAAWKLWEETAPKTARLHMVSIEKHPLTLEDFEKAHRNWPQLKNLSAILLSHYPSLVPGFHRISLNDRVTLTLCFGDIAEILPELHANVDAWFLDGFAPSKNPQMWEETLFPHIARLTNKGGTCSSFTSAGFVRRGLEAHGFEITRQKGFGRKWEMLVGYHQNRGENPTPFYPRSSSPWYSPPSLQQHKQAIVIGGGLAGTGAAYALAKRGWEITLIERREEIALEGSSNPQGVYMPILPRNALADDPVGHFTLASFLYTYQHLENFPNVSRETCGVLALDKEECVNTPHNIAYPVDAKEASALAGIPVSQGGIYFPKAGWLAPRELCNAQIAAYKNQITIHYHREALSLQRENGRWDVIGTNGNTIASAPVVILAQGADIMKLPETSWIPLKTIRGQLDCFAASAESASLRTIICNDGQILPSRNNCHWVGATFHPGDTPPSPTQDTKENQRRFAVCFGKTTESLAQKVGFRITTPDKLPVIGGVPDIGFYHNAYEGYHQGGRKGESALYPAPNYQPALYISTGFGSRGITTTPLASEYLASLISGETLPLPKVLTHALHPARFVMRKLRRSK